MASEFPLPARIPPASHTPKVVLSSVIYFVNGDTIFYGLPISPRSSPPHLACPHFTLTFSWLFCLVIKVPGHNLDSFANCFTPGLQQTLSHSPLSPPSAPAAKDLLWLLLTSQPHDTLQYVAVFVQDFNTRESLLGGLPSSMCLGCTGYSPWFICRIWAQRVHVLLKGATKWVRQYH